MFIDKKILMRLIEEAVEKTLFEQEEITSDTTPETETSAPEADSESSEIEAPPEADVGDLDLNAPDDSGDTSDISAGLEGDLGTEDEDIEGTNSTSGGSLSGGGGFSGGGGGFSFGDEGEAGLDADQPEEEEFASTIGPEDVEIPTDPIMAITDDAIQLLNKTKDPQKILQNVKSSIQRYFPEIDEAAPIIKSLWDTEDVVLRDVARRLLLFIKGV